MIKNIVRITTLIIFLSTSFLNLYLFDTNSRKVDAYSTTCPPSMTDYECLIYLQQQASKVAQEKSKLKSNLSSEQYNQLSLLDKIAYLDSKIVSTQNSIDDLEIQIETKNVEIRILGKDVTEKQDSINTLEQEITKLNSSVEKRVSMSYKYSLLTPVEIILETKNFDTLLRRFKYINESRKRDKQLLSSMADTQKQVNDQKVVLETKKLQVEKKRTQIEEEKTQLFKLKTDMASQKNERSILYAQSKAREKQIVSQLESNKAAEAKLTAQIMIYIQKNAHLMVNSGPVPKGAYIGKMGSTGCSTGDHLHFTIEYSTQPLGYASISPWNYLQKGPDYWLKSGGWTYYYVRSGNMQIPLAGTVVLTQDLHRGYSGGASKAIDLYSLSGSGAAVLAAWGGTLYKGTEPICGGKYAKIIHSNGMQTLYLHLK